MSLIGDLATAIASDLAGQPGWPPPGPRAVWYPDFDREELEAIGLTALVLPVTRDLELETRVNDLNGVNGDLTIHVAVIRPMQTARDDAFAHGDEVVGRAEQVALNMIGRRLEVAPGAAWACIEAEQNPIISREAATQYSLWISYIVTTWRRA